MVFTKSEVDPKLYFILVGFDPLVLVLQVDDLFLTSVEDIIVECKEYLDIEFEIKDIGLMHYFFGLEVWQVSREIFLE